MAHPRSDAVLVVVADDYGYAPAYDAGILEAAHAGTVDAVSAMVLRELDPEPLLGSGVEVGLHLELATPTSAALEQQLARFQGLFARPPSHLDGHHHCHARSESTAMEVARFAHRHELAVRSVGFRHRRLLRDLGVPTADRLLGRLDEASAPLPAELSAWLEGETPAARGVTEWMVHPGHAGGRSSYDRGRIEDLSLLLDLGAPERWRERGIIRLGPTAALGAKRQGVREKG